MLLTAVGAQASACGGGENDFTGSLSKAWNVAGNWSKASVPTSSELVCIPEGLSGPVIVPAKFDAEAKILLAQSGVTIEKEAALAISEQVAMEEPKVNEEHASRFTDLTVQGTLSTAGSWLMLSGNVLVEGEITSLGSGLSRNEDTARLLGGTLSGNGTLDIPFNNIAGTIEPGGAGVIGELHFTLLSAQQAGGTLVLDLRSGSEFDKLADPTSNFFFNEGTTIKVNVLGAYSPTVGTKWEFMSGGPGDPVETENIEPGSFTARSVSGGAEIELITAPPTVVTEAASSLAVTSATLNGTVNPNGVHVSSCEFEFGTTTAYGTLVPCTSLPGEGKTAQAASAPVTALSAGTTYHYRIRATSAGGARTGADETFSTPSAKGSEPHPEEETAKSSTDTGPPIATVSSISLSAPIGPAPLTPAAVEALLLGCGRSPLVLNDAYIHAGRVLIIGSAAKSLIGKKVKVIFGTASKQVASAIVKTNGEYQTTAPLPPAKIREALTTRYTAEIGTQRSLHLKLTRRLELEPPKASGTTVTLSGRVFLPLIKPIAPIVVEQQLECGKTTVVDTFSPPPSGQFRVTLHVPAGAKAGIYTLKSKVAANTHATAHGFTTYSLPLPVILG